MARIGSDRVARSETREGACSPRESVDSGLRGGCFLGCVHGCFLCVKSDITGGSAKFSVFSDQVFSKSLDGDGIGKLGCPGCQSRRARRSAQRFQDGLFHGVKKCCYAVF